MISALLPRPVALGMGLTWGYAAFLVAWGNAIGLVLGSAAALPGGSWAYALSGAALVAMSLAAARLGGLDTAALGLRGPARSGATVGAIAGVTASLAGVAALRLIAPAIVGGPIEYAPLATVSAPALLLHVGVLLPLGIVLPEEMAFRGVLLGVLARGRDLRLATAISATAFALWHGGVVFATLGDTTLGAASPWSAVAVAGAFLVIGAGGALLAWLRLATASLATTVAAHWTFNVVVLVGLWWTR